MYFYPGILAKIFEGQLNQNHITLVASHLGSNGVFDAHHANAGQTTEDVVLVVPVRFTFRSRKISVGEADGPQALGRHGLNDFLHHVVSVSGAKHFGLPVCC